MYCRQNSSHHIFQQLRGFSPWLSYLSDYSKSIQYLCSVLPFSICSFSNIPPFFMMDFAEPILSLSHTIKTFLIPIFYIPLRQAQSFVQHILFFFQMVWFRHQYALHVIANVHLNNAWYLLHLQWYFASHPNKRMWNEEPIRLLVPLLPNYPDSNQSHHNRFWK